MQNFEDVSLNMHVNPPPKKKKLSEAKLGESRTHRRRRCHLLGDYERGLRGRRRLPVRAATALAVLARLVLRRGRRLPVGQIGVAVRQNVDHLILKVRISVIKQDYCTQVRKLVSSYKLDK